MRLSLIPIGAYAPRWFMARVHVDPLQAVAASLTLESEVSVAIHFGTFRLADEAFDEPVRALGEIVRRSGSKMRGGDFRVLPFGHPLTIEDRVAPRRTA